MKLTQNFTLDEMTFSEAASRHSPPLDNRPSGEVIDNLRLLCATVLEPLRARLERPIFVSSGYRSPEVNSLIGGAKHSDHMRGLAADIHCPPLVAPFLMAEVVRLADGLPIKQAILEFSRWVHVSADLEAESPEFLIASNVDGPTRYTKWMQSLSA